MIPFNPPLEKLVAILLDDSIPSIGRLDWVPKSDDEKKIGFLGNSDTSPRPELKDLLLKPRIEVYYREDDELGDLLEGIHAGRGSFVARYLSLGGTIDKLQEDYLTLFNEPFKIS